MPRTRYTLTEYPTARLTRVDRTNRVTSPKSSVQSIVEVYDECDTGCRVDTARSHAYNAAWTSRRCSG